MIDTTQAVQSIIKLATGLNLFVNFVNAQLPTIIAAVSFVAGVAAKFAHGKYAVKSAMAQPQLKNEPAQPQAAEQK